MSTGCGDGSSRGDSAAGLAYSKISTGTNHELPPEIPDSGAPVAIRTKDSAAVRQVPACRDLADSTAEFDDAANRERVVQLGSGGDDGLGDVKKYRSKDLVKLPIKVIAVSDRICC